MFYSKLIEEIILYLGAATEGFIKKEWFYMDVLRATDVRFGVAQI